LKASVFHDGETIGVSNGLTDFLAVIERVQQVEAEKIVGKPINRVECRRGSLLKLFNFEGHASCELDTVAL
jgi:hypothetical protein